MSDDEIQPNLNPPADGNGEGAPADMEQDDPPAGLDAAALIAEMQQRMAAMDAHQASMQRQLNQVRGPLPAQPTYADATAERNPELLRVQLDSALERNEQLEADIRALRRENTGTPPALDPEEPTPAPRAVPGYKTPQPDKFSGASDKRRVEDFLSALRVFFTLSMVPVQYWAATAVQMLTDQAAAHFPNLARGLDVLTMSWRTFSSLLTQAYGRNDREPLARSKLDSLKQEGSVQTYARVFRETVACITRMPLSEGDKLHRFKSNLAPKLKDRCSVKPDGTEWDNLDELISFAVRQEINLQVSARSANPRSSFRTELNAALNGTDGFAEPAAVRRAAAKSSGGGKRKAASAGHSSAFKKNGDGEKLTVFGTSQREHERRKTSKTPCCLYCGEGHSIHACTHADLGRKGLASPAGNKPLRPLQFKDAP